MKTSNKLLLGLLVLIVLGMITATIKLKYFVDKFPKQNDQVSANNPFINIRVNGSSNSNTYNVTSSEGDLGYGLFTDKTKVLLSIDKNTTYEQLSQYKNNLKKLNIDLNIKRIEFDSDNKIKSLKISVDCNDGYKGNATQSLNGNEKIGFYRIYNDTTSSAFGMNAIPLE